MQPNKQAFTGRRRSRKTRGSVLAADRAAGVLIRLGGMGTIVAVSLVCVFLIWVVIPLFLPTSLDLLHNADLAERDERPRVLHLAIDEYLTTGWAAKSDGTIQAYRTDTGEKLAAQALWNEKRPTAWAFSLRDGHVGLAFADATVQLGKIRFVTNFVADEDLPPELKRLEIGQIASHDQGILERTPENQFRLQRLTVELEEPVQVKARAPIALMDLSVSSKGKVFAVLTEEGQLRIAQVTQKKNLLTGKVTSQLKEGTAEVELPDGKLPRHLLLSGLGDSVYLAWDDGALQRFDTRNITQPVLAEQLDLVEHPGARMTALAFLIGKTSLVSGDSKGNLRVWFRIKPDDAQTRDGAVLVKAHELPNASSPVVSLGPSPRSRMLSAAYEDGSVRLFHITSGQQLAEVEPRNNVRRLHALTVSPKDDAVFALADEKLLLWKIDATHPEATLGSILRPVWYEGYHEAQNVWQSSSGTDDFEEKYGLVPLIFGTLKATFYSMLFGAPLALLAAIYTSQFLHPRTKAKVKPTIEIMASLPSVVLGFLAALVIAPLVEDIVPECLAAFATVPFAFLLGAYLWQLIPAGAAVRAQRFRLLGMVLAMPLGLVLAALVGPLAERWLFAGDIKSWLDGQIGSGTGAWMFLLLPTSALVVVWASGAFVTPWLRRFAGGWPRLKFAALDLAKFLVACAATVVVAYLASLLLASLAWDPRGTFVDTYVQRNALIVGFIMGFAIIPIIYTISDDALSAVPESLRAASLGAGATPWQTAIRVVIPTAMSGLFSAMMIGLGRAVGETMIVLMAAGNTPVMDWNLFNGFRSLAANIAVEMPEAVLGSTHYRMLFLAALSLFLMTFVVNTIAEVVRMRFRKRAFQL